jgi:beta-N-acetylhexosaminidase
MLSFAEGVRSGADAVMVSTAYYRKIAPNPAAFSSTIMHTMLRGDLGFTGVIVSDDLGGAVQVRAWTPGERAVLFLTHHGNLVLTVDPGVVPAMYHAILSRAQQVRSFRAEVTSSALYVLRMKARLGLLC